MLQAVKDDSPNQNAVDRATADPDVRKQIERAASLLSGGLVGAILKEVVSDERLVSLIRDHLPRYPSETVTVLPARNEAVTGPHHRQLKDVFTAVQCGNVCLVGPAGSGKTTLAKQIAGLLGAKFYFTGAVSNEYKLTGFIDAGGNTIRTPFREAYEKGGLFLFDEIDGSSAGAVLAFNNALANGSMDFPDGNIPMHPDFYCIAAANTYWGGADMTYIGRNQLDGASLDRFIMIRFDYDEDLERALCGDDDFCRRVQRYRAACASHRIQHIISPRAAIVGAKLLKAGMSLQFVEQTVVFKGLPKEQVDKIKEGPRVQR